MNDFVLTFVALFVAMDIVGLLPLYLGLTENLPAEARRRLPWQSTATASLVGVGFLLLGDALFRILGITVGDFQVAGGLLLLVLAVSDLLNAGVALPQLPPNLGAVPLGVPLIVGPAVLTTLVVLVQAHGYVPTLVAFAANVLIVFLALRNAGAVTRILGEAGARAVGKVAALFLAAFGVSLIRRGLPTFLGR
jgi:multiple antibiotic resistance protein